MDFKDIKVSTQTYIVQSNISNVDLVKLAERFEPAEPIINLKYKTIVKGPIKSVKHKSKKNPVQKTFLNCVTLTIFVHDKNINVKIFNNGVFQLTGCKYHGHATTCIKIVIALLHKLKCFTWYSDKPPMVYLFSVMRNIDFDIFFKIDREAMAIYVHNNTEYHVPPLTKGYMGIKIKIPLKNIDDLPVDCILFDKNTGIGTDKPHIEYKTLMSEIIKDEKKLKKERFISISVFQNGKVLMSGPDIKYQEKYYNWFIQFVNENRDKISYISKVSTKKTFKLQ